MEVVEMVSDYLVEWKPGGAGLRLDDRRRSILVGEVAVDRIYLETIGQLRQQLFRPLESVSSPPNGDSAEIRRLSLRFAAPQWL